MNSDWANREGISDNAGPGVYVGLKAIADRMGWPSDDMAAYWIKKEGFPAYKLHSDGRGLWITDDVLILKWQLNKVSLVREELKERIREKIEAKELEEITAPMRRR